MIFVSSTVLFALFLQQHCFLVVFYTKRNHPLSQVSHGWRQNASKWQLLILLFYSVQESRIKETFRMRTYYFVGAPDKQALIVSTKTTDVLGCSHLCSGLCVRQLAPGRACVRWLITASHCPVSSISAAAKLLGSSAHKRKRLPSQVSDRRS